MFIIMTSRFDPVSKMWIQADDLDWFYINDTFPKALKQAQGLARALGCEDRVIRKDNTNQMIDIVWTNKANTIKVKLI